MDFNLIDVYNVFIDFCVVAKDILLCLGGLGICGYLYQKKNEKRDAAALIVLQIDELKEKLLEVNDMIVDGVINETSFYETLDIINDNQWEKHKHLFVNKIDNMSYKVINSFYEYTLCIKEQLSFAKRLQQNQYFNIQGMLDSNCNAILMDNLNKSMINLKDLIENIPTNSNNDEMIKSLILSNITSEEDINYSKMYQRCNATKDVFRKIVNCDPYITYIPKQIATTLTKYLTKVNSLEVIGCEGYKKLKKIAKIK